MRKAWRIVLPRLALIFVGVSTASGILAYIDLSSQGPYVSWHNHRIETLTRDSKLIGRSEADAVSILGHPSRVTDDATFRSLDYHPYPGLPFQKARVFIEGGRVSGVKLFDD